MSYSLAGKLSTQHAACAPIPLARFPEESLLLGSLKAYAKNGLAFFQRCERIAGIVQTRFVWKPAYIITDPKAIADVLINHPQSFVKPYVLHRLKVLFGNGLLTSDGDAWSHSRRLVQPAFGSGRMSGFLDLVRDNTERMVSSWSHGEVRDVYGDLVDLCMKNITQTMFGVYDEELGAIARALTATCHELVHAVFDVVRPWPFRFPRRLKRRLKRELDHLDKYLRGLIDRRNSEPPRDDFLGLLLSGNRGRHRPLGRQAILDESVTLLLAGHETTASALVWSLYLLAQHPGHANALAADLAWHLNGQAPSYGELVSLELLGATLDETLRLYPATHRIARTVKTPVTVGGHPLPVGADVVIPQWAVHRSARWYQEPDAFEPGRWTAAFRKSLPKFAYFPFSGGARTCVGSQFAWCESAVILGLLAQRFRFSLSDTSPLAPYEGLTLLPASGRLEVKLETRDTFSVARNFETEDSNLVRRRLADCRGFGHASFSGPHSACGGGDAAYSILPPTAAKESTI